MPLIQSNDKPKESGNHYQKHKVHDLTPTSIRVVSWLCNANTNNNWYMTDEVYMQQGIRKNGTSYWYAHREDGPAVIVFDYFRGLENHSYYVNGCGENIGPNGFHDISYYHNIIRGTVASTKKDKYWSDHDGLVAGTRYSEDGSIIGCTVYKNRKNIGTVMLPLLQNGITETDPLWIFQFEMA